MTRRWQLTDTDRVLASKFVNEIHGIGPRPEWALACKLVELVIAADDDRRNIEHENIRQQRQAQDTYAYDPHPTLTAIRNCTHAIDALTSEIIAWRTEFNIQRHR